MRLSVIWDKLVEILTEAETLNTNTETMVSDISFIEGYTEKIDGAATDGLNGTLNSLAYRVNKIEDRFHSPENWMGSASTPSGETHAADRIGEDGGSFQLDGGNDAWGGWVLILGSDDTPIRAGQTYFNPHEILVTATENASVYYIQMAEGESGAAGLASGDYTETVYNATVQKDTAIIDVYTNRFLAGTKLWARCWSVGDNTGTLDFYLGVHEYGG